MTSLGHVILEPVEVDEFCHPSTIIWVGDKDYGWGSAIGDNLSVKPLKLYDKRTYDAKPYIEMNLAGIWNLTKNFEEFVREFDKDWLAMYLHLDVRCECTGPPVGRGGLPLKYKGLHEAWYLNNLLEVVYGKKGEDLPLHPPD